MKKIVLYLRYSSSSQSEQSIEGQERECQAFANTNGYKIIKTYIDRATTGTNDDRASFQQMIKDSAKHLFEFVLVYQLDRFARNRYDSAIYKNILKKNGVRVLSAKENITSDASGIILESMLEGMAEYYSVELAQKVKRGMKETVLKGNFTGGKPPYAYTIENKKYVVVPHQALVVQSIFNDYAGGKTIDAIRLDLKQREIKNSNNKPFVKNTILHILNNEKYIGNLIYGENIVENIIPAIIDKETFQNVANRMKKNKKRASRTKAIEYYLLTGKLFCGDCHSPMSGESGTSKTGAKYNYYKCFGARKKKCCKKAVNKKWLENFIINSILEILDDKTISLITKELILYIKEEINNPTRLDNLNSQLKETNKALTNLVNAIEKGIFNETTNSRILHFEKQKNELEFEIEKEKLNVEVKLTEEEISYWLHGFKAGNKEDITFKERTVDTFINKVILYEDKVVIILNIKGNNKLEKSISDIERELSSLSNQLGVPKQTKTNYFVRYDYIAIVVSF